MLMLYRAAAVAAVTASLALGLAPEGVAQPGKADPVKKIAVKDTASAAYAALVDLNERVPPGDWPYTRYLSLYEVPKAQRDDHIRVFNFWLNSLSRNAKIYLATRVPGTDDALLRINTYDYQWDPKVWDKLAEESRYYLAKQVRTRKVADVEEYEEPVYKTEKETVLVPDGYGRYTQQVREKKVLVKTVKKTREVAVRDQQETVLTVGPWIEPRVAADLIQKTQSVFPVLPAREFLDETSEDKFYGQFLNLGKTEADFFKVIDADPAAVARLQSDRQGTVTFSGVTLKNRRLTRLPTRATVQGGYFWFSTDARDDVAAKNYLEILLDRGPSNFDATEQIASLANGLQVYALFNNKGERQGEAPPDIAGDKSSTSNDLRVRNPISCVRCHVDGIIPFKSVFPQLRKSIRIDAYKRDDLYRLDQLYGSDIHDTFEPDQKVYAAAIKKVAGKEWTPAKVAQLYASIYHEWDEQPVTVDVAAADLGVTPAQAKAVLRRSERNTLLSLVADDPVPISRGQWKALFPEAAVLLFNSRVKEAEKRAVMPVVEPVRPRPRVADFEKAFPRHGKTAVAADVKEDEK